MTDLNMQHRTAHTDRVLDLCAASGIDALDTIEAENGVVRVRIAPLLVSFEDVNRTLTRRMVEYGWYYGVGFSAVSSNQYPPEDLFRYGVAS